VAGQGIGLRIPWGQPTARSNPAPGMLVPNDLRNRGPDQIDDRKDWVGMEAGDSIANGVLGFNSLPSALLGFVPVTGTAVAIDNAVRQC
jgi:hypothetical protein